MRIFSRVWKKPGGGGINMLALYVNVEYLKGEPFGQADVDLEGLKKRSRVENINC